MLTSSLHKWHLKTINGSFNFKIKFKKNYKYEYRRFIIIGFHYTRNYDFFINIIFSLYYYIKVLFSKGLKERKMCEGQYRDLIQSEIATWFQLHEIGLHHAVANDDDDDDVYIFLLIAPLYQSQHAVRPAYWSYGVDSDELRCANFTVSPPYHPVTPVCHVSYFINIISDLYNTLTL